MANTDIKESLLKANMPQWKLAELLGIPESSFCKFLRHELDADIKETIMDLINHPDHAETAKYKVSRLRNKAKLQAKYEMHRENSEKYATVYANKVAAEVERYEHEMSALREYW